METTQIYDILLTLLNSNNETLLSSLGVTDITTGQSALRTLDAGQVRDLYETCRPTPKPRRNRNADLLRRVWTIREARCVRNAVREKIQRTPSAKAIHDFLPIWQERFHTFNIKNIEDMLSCYLWHLKNNLKEPYLPKSYDKFYKHKNGTVKPKQKVKVIEIVREYMVMKKYQHPDISENKTQIAVYGHRTRSKDEILRWCPKFHKRITDDFGIYHILDYMTDKNKNGIYNFLSHKGKISWHYR